MPEFCLKIERKYQKPAIVLIILLRRVKSSDVSQSKIKKSGTDRREFKTTICYDCNTVGWTWAWCIRWKMSSFVAKSNKLLPLNYNLEETSWDNLLKFWLTLN